ncbi:hypothetical protein [uncultured Nitratireductor sp.]|uniref:hypothetical protein n=1 Tax=uncultured Nitratireductor sp. TaxID=520953 RepID=UPI00260052D6|nr:hypothetical protein [uncultured Nitratireductor sp.]
MSNANAKEQIYIIGITPGCAGCPTPQRVLDGAAALAEIDILPKDLPREIEDMVEFACGPCGDSVLCERVDGCLEISIAKKEGLG